MTGVQTCALPISGGAASTVVIPAGSIISDVKLYVNVIGAASRAVSLTVNGTTTFNVSSGSGIIVNFNASTTADPYPTIKYVQWNNFVSQSLIYSSSAQITYVAIDEFGAISQLNSAFTPAQFKDRIILGRVLHQTGSVTNGTDRKSTV